MSDTGEDKEDGVTARPNGAEDGGRVAGIPFEDDEGDTSTSTSNINDKEAGHENGVTDGGGARR